MMKIPVLVTRRCCKSTRSELLGTIRNKCGGTREQEMCAREHGTVCRIRIVAALETV